MPKRSLFRFAFILLCFCRPGFAQSLPEQESATVDQIAAKALKDTGVPSALVGIVKGGKIVFVKGYGDGRLDPPLASGPRMRYSIGSISKQFTVAAILLLQEQQKLSLDDPVAKYFPNLTRAGEVTIRQLLSHTSGYQDYYPQDYVPQFMTQATTAQHIMDLWAKKPLDFEPGTRWQYSNTNYVIAGAIVEKITGRPLFDLLHEKIFDPLGMKSVLDTDRNKLSDTDAIGYFRYASGPPHPELKEGNGWLSAAGELSMTVADLLRWDISLIDQSVLKADSYRQMETEVRLKDGGPTGYALGLDVFNQEGHRVLEHSGEVSGFTAANAVLPDDGAAVAVLTNQMASNASGVIARDILRALLLHGGEKNGGNKDEDAPTAQARRILEGLQRGTIDRSLFTDDANQFFSQAALNDYRNSLGSLGPPLSLISRSQSLRGGMIFRSFTAQFLQRTFNITTFEQPDGKLEQYLVLPRE